MAAASAPSKTDVPSKTAYDATAAYATVAASAPTTTMQSETAKRMKLVALHLPQFIIQKYLGNDPAKWPLQGSVESARKAFEASKEKAVGIFLDIKAASVAIDIIVKIPDRKILSEWSFPFSNGNYLDIPRFAENDQPVYDKVTGIRYAAHQMDNLIAGEPVFVLDRGFQG